MAYLQLAREVPGKSASDPLRLPGIPVAIVLSNNPDLAGAFLCVCTPPLDKGRSAFVSDAANKAALKQARLRRRQLQFTGEKDRAALSALHTAGSDASAVKTGEEHGIVCAGSKRARDYRETDEDSEDEEHAPCSSGSASMPSTSSAPLGKTGYIKLPPGTWFEPLPLVHPEDRTGKEPYRTVTYVPGRSGAGKTYWLSGLARKYHKLWPDNPIFGVCKTPMKNDKAFSGLTIKQIPIEMIMGKGGSLNTIESFGYGGSMVIFDDWDSFEDAQRKAVLGLIKDCINLGRKQRLSVCVTSHLLSNYNETRAIISEAETIVLFPNQTMPKTLSYMCERLGMDKDVVARLREKGRWVAVHNAAPLYLLSEDECELI